MARCEDFPCCGHEMGCCPDFDDSGRQLNMKCVCGATVDINSRSSLCEGCLNAGREDEDYMDWRDSRDEQDDNFDDDDFEEGGREYGYYDDEAYDGMDYDFDMYSEW